MSKLFVAITTFTLAACLEPAGGTEPMFAEPTRDPTNFLLERVDRDLIEYTANCPNGYDWTISARNINPDGHGTGELRIRDVSSGGDTVLGYGGTGYLINTGTNWIVGGHGHATEPLGYTPSVQLERGASVTVDEFTASFVTVGYHAGAAVVALTYHVRFDCDTYTEDVTVRALADFPIAFEYAAVATGPGECALPGAYHSVNGMSGYGCAPSSTYTWLEAAQTLVLSGDAHRLVVTTDSNPVSTLVRDRDNLLKAYAVTSARQVVAGEVWRVVNTYRIESVL
jgi:hypothetical protein